MVVADVVIALAVLVGGLRRPCEDDLGDGSGQVVLPDPRPVSIVRTATFYLLFTGLSSLLVGIRPGIGPVYAALAVRVAQACSAQHLAIASYGAHLHGSLRLLVVIDVVCLAAVLRASPLRRGIVLAHGLAYLVLALGLDAVCLVVAAGAHLLVVTYVLMSAVASLAGAVLVMMRILATTFSVPRPTTVAARRGRLRADSAIFTSAAVVAIVGVVVGVAALTAEFAGSQPALELVVLFGYPAVFVLLYLVLMILGPRPRPGPAPLLAPPLSVIIPAYNEAAGIALTLESVDRAASAYPGPVFVVVADDGSTDETVEVVRGCMRRFSAATGLIVAEGHAGKAGALNHALARVETDLVVRVDADVVVDAEAFVPLPGWFDDPAVGTVGALSLPRQELRGWICRARLVECLLSFAFSRLALQRVDAVSCIPGTFTAFRRAPAVEAGGFVMGMNGEDADLTMQLGRLGYRAVLDPRIRSFEDVPATLGGLREQRTRWNRAGLQVAARHSPLLAGLGGPRNWFMYLRTTLIRVTALLRPLVYVHALQVVLLAPSFHDGVGPFFVLYLAAGFPMLAVSAYLAIRHGFASKLVWLPVMYPFTIVRRIFTLEAMLSLPTRTVVPRRLRARQELGLGGTPSPAGA